MEPQGAPATWEPTEIGTSSMGFFSTKGDAAICEIRWHGRGGQGAITSAQYLAQAAYLGGFKGVTSAPTFGAERRGAPVTASTRLSPEPLRVFSQVEQPDVVIVLDDTLFDCAAPTDGLQDDGWLVVNTVLPPDALGVEGPFRIATADASAAAHDAELIVAGTVMVNTAMLGALARATGLITLEHIHETLRNSYAPAVADKNYRAAQLTHDRTQVSA